MTNAQDCSRFGKWIGGCKFEGRYDTDEPDLAQFEVLRGVGIPALVESLKAETYVRDVCIRCGRTVERGA